MIKASVEIKKGDKTTYIINIEGQTLKKTSKLEKTHAVIVRGRKIDRKDCKKWNILSINSRKDLAEKEFLKYEDKFTEIMIVELKEIAEIKETKEIEKTEITAEQIKKLKEIENKIGKERLTAEEEEFLYNIRMSNI